MLYEVITIALNGQIIDGVRAGQADAVQPIAEKIRRATGAEFVVVGDRNGIRLSHPNPARIGKKFVGGDENDAVITSYSIHYTKLYDVCRPSSVSW